MKVAWILLVSSVASAASQAEIAANLDQEGVDLMFKSQFEDAAAKFHDAASRDPQAKYYFNLCSADYQTGEFGEALIACKAAANNTPAPELQVKIDKMQLKIRGDMKAQHIDMPAAMTNEDGKDLMFSGKYDEAAAKFREAIKVDAQPKYFLNLCTTLDQAKKYSDALEACNAVAKHKPQPDLQKKTDAMIVKIHADATKK